MGNRAKPFCEWISPEPNTGCWLWTGHWNQNGYGAASGRQKGAHRLSWRIHRGAIPPGMFVCHKCDVPSCVNPDHLFLGTAKDNMVDKMNKGRCRNLRGEDCPTSKLTREQVIAIRSSKKFLKELSAEHGISIAQASRVRSGKNWGHLA